VARLIELVETNGVDMVIHNGDISYADGDMAHWDDFMRKIEPIAARVFYQVSYWCWRAFVFGEGGGGVVDGVEVSGAAM
jgi:hypothetical protein